MINIEYKTEFFEEDDQIVALVPELNVSSFGRTLDEAKRRIQEAVELFLEGCAALGSLEEVLEESGFALSKEEVWRRRDPFVTEEMRVAVAE